MCHFFPSRFSLLLSHFINYRQEWSKKTKKKLIKSTHNEHYSWVFVPNRRFLEPNRCVSVLLQRNSLCNLNICRRVFRLIHLICTVKWNIHMPSKRQIERDPQCCSDVHQHQHYCDVPTNTHTTSDSCQHKTSPIIVS